MTWNWQQSDWPHFTWNRAVLLRQEDQFLLGGGVLVGVTKHLSAEDWDQVRVEAMSDEAITTSEIEGEILNRASVQSSIQRQLGLTTDAQRVAPKEQGISELIVDLYGTIDQPLSAEVLFDWHRMVMSGRSDLGMVGSFRTSAAPMQVIPGATYAPKVHFEAPPSSRVPEEMSQFLTWFERTAPGGVELLRAVTRAGIAHLYFESIHPFGDGNGRIGRAIAEKALVQGLGKPIFIGLAHGILARQRSYYEALEAATKKNDVSSWLTWFAAVVIESQASTMANVEFLVAKTKLLDRVRGQINARQTKALLRMFKEGPKGFAGGMSAGNYSTITGASLATATRDLNELVALEVLSRHGELKHTRYRLHLSGGSPDHKQDQFSAAKPIQHFRS